MPDDMTNLVNLVEVAGYRDPDGDTTIEVFINGVQIKPKVEIVDPGAGAPYPLSVWRDRTHRIGRSNGSAAWKRAMLRLRDDAESDYTVNDLCPAQDRQPGIVDITRLDPTVWVGEEELRYPTEVGPELAEDNTLRAGRALFAVKAFYHRLTTGELMEGLRAPGRLVPKTEPTHEPAGHAVAAFAQLTAPNAGPEKLPATVRDLLADLHHLADTKSFCLTFPVDPRSLPGDLDTVMAALMQHLAVIGQVWARALQADSSGPHDPGDLTNFDLLFETAYTSYRGEVTGMSMVEKGEPHG